MTDTALILIDIQYDYFDGGRMTLPNIDAAARMPLNCWPISVGVGLRSILSGISIHPLKPRFSALIPKAMRSTRLSPRFRPNLSSSRTGQARLSALTSLTACRRRASQNW